MTRTASPAETEPSKADPGIESPMTVSGSAFGAVGDNCVSVHRRAIETRNIDVADHRIREHSTRCAAQRHHLGRQRVQLRIQPSKSRGYGVTLRESAHPHVVGRPFTYIAHAGWNSRLMLPQGPLSSTWNTLE
jgi:hypothetical protein